MATAAQIASNRRNALKSTGPRTPSGLQKSSRNALKHGLCSPRLSLLYDESPEELVVFHDRLYQRLAPTDALQELVVERVISQAVAATTPGR